MTDKITVDNYRLDSYNVKTTELTDKSHIQHTRLDIGSGTTESPVTASNPLPVSGTIIPEPTQLALKLDESASPVTYVGEAETGSLGSDAVWRIKKIDETSGLVITWADGNADFDNIWDNRLSLVYS